MKRLSTILLVIVIMLVLTVECANILDGELLSVTEREVSERDHAAQISISAIDEFRELLIELIESHESEAQMHYHHFGTEDIQNELDLVAADIMRNHPVGAFAVSNIAVTATRIITYFEVNVTIEYSRTPEEIESIITVASERHFLNELSQVMKQHIDQALFQSTLQLTDETISEKISNIYYQNPSSIVMLPIVTVESFPEEGDERIYLIQFSYTYNYTMMRQFSEILSSYIAHIVEGVAGDTDSLKLLNLVRDLAASIRFEEEAARMISVPGAQNISATAFGALFRAHAVGEGFAMAFKAISNELGFDNRIVLGYLDGWIHAWNIVYLDGYFYHIDIAMISEYGLERAFLKTDDDFEAMGYEWDRENTVICNGPLTFEDILALEEPEYYYDELGEGAENDYGTENSEAGDGETSQNSEADNSTNNDTEDPQNGESENNQSQNGQPDNGTGNQDENPIDEPNGESANDTEDEPDGESDEESDEEQSTENG